VATSLVSTGGNLGGFFSPMLAGYLLDKFSYNAVFVYFAVCAAIGLITLLTMDEPV
jgi:dipeptide/tripeptide permease